MPRRRAELTVAAVGGNLRFSYIQQRNQYFKTIPQKKVILLLKVK